MPHLYGPLYKHVVYKNKHFEKKNLKATVEAYFTTSFVCFFCMGIINTKKYVFYK